MRNLSLKWLYSLVFIFCSLTLSGCDLVGDIFEFGMWTALIIIGIAMLILYLIVRMFRRR